MSTRSRALAAASMIASICWSAGAVSSATEATGRELAAGAATAGAFAVQAGPVARPSAFLADPDRGRLLRVAQAARPLTDVSSVGNPALAPLKWAGLLLIDVDKQQDHARACTAQFVSRNVILTAAHCLQDDETGKSFDPNRTYFLAQYQNGTASRVYRPICASNYSGWTAVAHAHGGDERARAEATHWQWDYALMLLDGGSDTGHYGDVGLDSLDQFPRSADSLNNAPHAVVTGYPAAMLEGKVIQAADGIVAIPDARFGQHLFVAGHGREGLTVGSSGGAWVLDFGSGNGNRNLIISVNSFTMKDSPGLSFGPAILSRDFHTLLDYVAKGCPR